MSLLSRYTELLGAELPLIALLAALPALLWWVGVRRSTRFDVVTRSRILPVGLVLGALGVGLFLAVDRASVVDDAFISFRYARNWVEGEGLVFNPGERVEGYTNFLWTLILGSAYALSGIELPTLALWLCLLVFVLSVAVVWRLGSELYATGRGYALPLSACLFAVQAIVCAYATTGLETLFASLLVNLGVLYLAKRRSVANVGIAGAFLVAATLTRPDHSLFYVAGGVALFGPSLMQAASTRRLEPLWREFKPFAAYALSLVPYSAVLLFKLAYYGSIVPNTYYAKSAYDSYYSQGLHYAGTFYLGSHLWLLVVPGALWVLRGVGSVTVRTFVGVSFVLYNVYVAKVGGDFMVGRLYVVLIPLVLLAAEGWVRSLAVTASAKFAGKGDEASSPWLRWTRALPVLLAAGLLLSTAHGVPIISHDKSRYHGITDESSYYRVEWAYPLRIQNGNYRTGKLFAEVLEDRGVQPLLASSGIGMLGYYSRLPVVDLVGLTDPVVAKTKLDKRGRPGHEKWASERYLRDRRVLIARYPKLARRYERYRELTRLRLGRGMPKNWSIFIYDRDVMRKLRDTAPELQFTDFELYLDDYIRRVDRRSPKSVERDLRFFRRYYFDHNDDPGRLRALEARTRHALNHTR